MVPYAKLVGDALGLQAPLRATCAHEQAQVYPGRAPFDLVGDEHYHRDVRDV